MCYYYRCHTAVIQWRHMCDSFLSLCFVNFKFFVTGNITPRPSWCWKDSVGSVQIIFPFLSYRHMVSQASLPNVFNIFFLIIERLRMHLRVHSTSSMVLRLWGNMWERQKVRHFFFFFNYEKLHLYLLPFRFNF